MRGLLLAVTLAVAIARPAAAEPQADARAVLDRAIAKQKDARALKQALEELDRLIVKNPNDADAHYARGWVLSASGRNEDAVISYDRAFQLDRLMVTAPYNAGVVLGRIGNLKEAAIRFDRALKVSPRHVDAAYNAGQTYYDLRDYKTAAARWEAALKLQPEDFQIAKRILQAYVAAGNTSQIKRARDRVLAMWRTTKDPEIARQKDYLYDLFTVGTKLQVNVYETFEPGGVGATLLQARVSNAADKQLGSIGLERIADGYIVGLDKGGAHTTLSEHAWKKQPDYRAFKSVVRKLVETKF